MGMVRKLFAVVLSIAMLMVAIPSPEAAATAPGIIKGTIVDANGQPLAGYHVKVTDASGVVYQSEPTGADGSYEIGGLPEGTYTYTILDPDGKTVPARIPPVNLEAGKMVTQPIALVPGKGNKKGALIAWIVGGGAAVLALALAGGGGGNSSSHHHMTPSTALPKTDL
jgi:hypothetical protein